MRPNIRWILDKLFLLTAITLIFGSIVLKTRARRDQKNIDLANDQKMRDHKIIKAIRLIAQNEQDGINRYAKANANLFDGEHHYTQSLIALDLKLRGIQVPPRPTTIP